MTERADAARYTVISADGHAGADLLDYRPYLESKYHDEFDAWAATYVNPYDDLARPNADRNWDSARRLRELEARRHRRRGALPEHDPAVLPEGTSLSAQPPSADEYELRWAGLRAHNRWLADFCAAGPGPPRRHRPDPPQRRRRRRRRGPLGRGTTA